MSRGILTVRSTPKIDSENGTEIAANQEIEEYAESLIAQYEKDLEASGRRRPLFHGIQL